MAGKLSILGDALASLARSGKADDMLRRVNADDFFNAISRAAQTTKGDMKIGDMLTVYNPADYKKMRTFLSKDKMSGYALKGDELVSVFSIPGGRGENIAMDAAARGARNLDNFDVRGKLPELYGRAGFVETQRYPYDPQYASELSDYVNTVQPDVVFMGMDPRVAAQLRMLRGAGAQDVRSIMGGGRGRITRNRKVQDMAALAALAGLIGAENQR